MRTPAQKMKPMTQLTRSEYGLLCYLCEQVEENQEVLGITDGGVQMAERLSQILSNIQMSENNQCKVNELKKGDETWEIAYAKQYDKWLRGLM